MTIRCDHCRKPLGSSEQYWRMNFCSAECVAAYRRRLDPVTLAKIDLLEGKPSKLPAHRLPQIPLGRRADGGWQRCRSALASFPSSLLRAAPGERELS